MASGPQSVAARSVAAAEARAAKLAPAPKFFHPELDQLRWFAFFGVFLSHSLPKDARVYLGHGVPAPLALFFSSLARAGTFGVDLFFVLSAFLITELLLREREERGRVAVGRFYARRALRIWPLYFFFLLLARLVSQPAFGHAFTWKQVLAFAAFSGNWWFVFRGANDGIVGPLWSVSVEEQFYLLWPNFVRRLSLRKLLAVAAALFALAVICRSIAAARGADGLVLWKNTFLRLDPLACGIALAVLLHPITRKTGARCHPNRSKSGTGWGPRCWGPRMGRPSPGLRWLILILGFGTVLWVAHLGDGTGMFLPNRDVGWGYAVIALCCAAILFSIFHAPGSAPAWTRSRPLVYLGKISYGLYVYHMLALGIALQVFAGHLKSLGGFAAYWCFALALTMALAMASYRWLESPFLRLKQRFTAVESRPV